MQLTTTRLTRQDSPHTRHSRALQVEVLDYWRRHRDHITLLELSHTFDIPLSTLHDWILRAEALDVPEAWRAFFESPQGLLLLRRIVIALHFVCGLLGACSIRVLCQFLELSGLGPFVACSHGAQHRLSLTLEDHVSRWGRDQEMFLAEHWQTPDDLTLALDETFHKGRPCLVAMEPHRRYLFVEQYAEDRTAETWHQMLNDKLNALGVSCSQIVSDQARALIKVAGMCSAHASADIFHVQCDAIKSLARPLARCVDQARLALEKFDEGSLAWCAQSVLLQKAINERDELRKAWRSLSTSYHPYDPSSGQARRSEEVEGSLKSALETLRQACHKLGLSERAHARLEKSARVIPTLVATISYYHARVQARLEEVSMSEKQRAWMQRLLVPLASLKQRQRRLPKGERRRQIEETIADLEIKRRRVKTLRELGEEERARLEALADELASMFQASTSCVEGRNGWLRLLHHSWHRLSNRRLEALKVVHNNWLRDEKGSSAAGRLFGREPENLFESLLKTMPSIPRPRARRCAHPHPA